MLVGYGLSFSIVPISGGTSPKRQQTAATVSTDKSASVYQFSIWAAHCALVTGKQEVIPNNPSGNRLLAPVVKKGSPAAAASG